jgi:hypothetical protein
VPSLVADVERGNRGHFRHQAALCLHELSDVNRAPLHMTVPKGICRNRKANAGRAPLCGHPGWFEEASGYTGSLIVTDRFVLVKYPSGSAEIRAHLLA